MYNGSSLHSHEVSVIPLFKSICFLIMILFLSACPSKNDSAPVSAQLIPVKGNPMVFVEGTVMDSESGINAAIIEESLDEEWVVNIRGFFEEKQEVVDSMQAARQRQVAPDSDLVSKISDSVKKYKFKEINDDAESAKHFSLEEETESDEGTKFEFQKNGDSYLLAAMQIGTHKIPMDETIKVLHYSVKNDQSAISLLVRFGSPENNPSLISYEFVKVKGTGFLQAQLNTIYKYLYGPGVKVAWDQHKDLNVTVCDQNTSFLYSRHAHEAALVWRQEVLEGRLNYNVSEDVEICPPFSDLNTQSIIHVKDWIVVYKEMATAAFATMTVNYTTSEFVDGDIMFLESEWEESLPDNLSLSDSTVYSNSYILERYKRTITHEMGHFFGLHHQFDDSTPSIMGYSGVRELTEYDREAIQALYPEIQVEEEESNNLGPQ